MRWRGGQPVGHLEGLVAVVFFLLVGHEVGVVVEADGAIGFDVDVGEGQGVDEVMSGHDHVDRALVRRRLAGGVGDATAEAVAPLGGGKPVGEGAHHHGFCYGGVHAVGFGGGPHQHGVIGAQTGFGDHFNGGGDDPAVVELEREVGVLVHGNFLSEGAQRLRPPYSAV